MYIKSNEIERIKGLLIDYEVPFEIVDIQGGVEKVLDSRDEDDYYQSSEEYYESSC